MSPRWRRALVHPWIVGIVTLVLSVVITDIRDPERGPGLGDPFVVGEFEYTLLTLACGPITGRNPEGDQLCEGTVATVNQSGDEGHPSSPRLWLVTSDGDRFRATRETERALTQDLDPGDAAFVTVEFTPPADLVFRKLDVETADGAPVSVRLFAGEGLAEVPGAAAKRPARTPDPRRGRNSSALTEHSLRW